MRYLLLTLIFATGVLLAPHSSSAYSVYDYDASYTPYNLGTALLYDTCNDEVKEFDDAYNELRDEYNYILSGGNGGMTKTSAYNATNALLDEFKLNDFKYEDEFKNCIDSGQKAELAAEEKALEKAQEEAEETALQTALTNCDFTYIDTLTNSQKIAYNKEITTCKDAVAQKEADAEKKLAEEEAKRQAEIDSAVSEALSKQLQQAPQVPAPVSKPTPAPPPTEVETVEPEPVDDEGTSTDGTITLTEEELDRLVEERAEAANMPEEEPVVEKPSFFKKILSFFFGWL